MGHKGSGKDFTLALKDNLKLNGFHFDEYWCDGNLPNVSNKSQSHEFITTLGKSAPERLFKSFLFALKFLFSKNYEEYSYSFVFSMPSPYDIPLSIAIKIKGHKIFRVIHDAKAHKGEIWPDPISLRILVYTSDYLIVLSKFVNRQLEKRYDKPILQIIHPILPFVFEHESKIQENNEEADLHSYVLMIGRIKKYKGLDLLLKSWNNFKDSSFNLLIVGESKTNKSNNQSNIHYVNKWVSNYEICHYIFHAEVVVFPYLEASQSGLLPIVRYFNKKTVVSNVGGLAEQVAGYKNAIILNKLNPTLLAEAIQDSLQSETEYERYLDTSNWSKSLIEKLS